MEQVCVVIVVDQAHVVVAAVLAAIIVKEPVVAPPVTAVEDVDAVVEWVSDECIKITKAGAYLSRLLPSACAILRIDQTAFTYHDSFMDRISLIRF